MNPKPKSCFVLLIFLLISLPPVFAAGGSVPENDDSPMGINLTAISYYGTELVFVDIFKQSQPFQSQMKGKPYGKGPRLHLTPGGWPGYLEPGQSADTLMCRNIENYPSGDYICLYDGRGRIEFGFDARVKSRSPGRIIVSVDPSDAGILLSIRETFAEDPVRNIRLILPGFENTYEKQPFHPLFLKHWSIFKVIRFMDWMRTNDSKISRWSDRPLPSSPTQAGPGGAALEYMIKLANTLHADPWFCMPHQVTDDYISHFARLLKQKLNPDLRIYIEYSNEAWNTKFKQAKYCLRMGRAMQLDENSFSAQLSFYAKRSVEVFRMWEAAMGGTSNLVRVLSAQCKNPWTSEKILTFENAYQYADALAIAPYFGMGLGNPDRQGLTEAMNIEQIMRFCRKDIHELSSLTSRHHRIAEQYGLDLIAYEGGQHLVGYGGAENSPILQNLFFQANNHPRMKQMYREQLNGWRIAGGRLFTAFSSMCRYGKWGSWGLLEFFDQDPETAPKYRAVMEFMESNPKWWK